MKLSATNKTAAKFNKNRLRFGLGDKIVNAAGESLTIVRILAPDKIDVQGLDGTRRIIEDLKDLRYF